MPRLVLTRARSWTSGPYKFLGGKPVTVDDEGDYNRMMRSGMVTDPDKRWVSISPKRMLPKLRDGSNVLVVRDMGLGDVLMVSIVLRALAEKWPALRFTFATSRPYVPLFRDCTFLRRVSSIFECDGDYPNTIELRGYSERSPKKKSLDRIDLFADYCDVRLSDYSIPLQITDDELASGRALLGRPGPAGTMVVAVRGSTRVRSWPMEHLVVFAEMAASDGWRVVFADHERFQDLPSGSRISNQTAQWSVGQLACATAAADLVVAPDTGIVHLAEAVGTRCLAIYSTTPPELRLSHYQYVKAFWARELACAPCYDRGCREIPCLTSVSPDAVLRAIDQWDELPASFSAQDVGVGECIGSA